MVMFSNLNTQSFHEVVGHAKIRQFRECPRLDEHSASACHGFRIWANSTLALLSRSLENKVDFGTDPPPLSPLLPEVFDNRRSRMSRTTPGQEHVFSPGGPHEQSETHTCTFDFLASKNTKIPREDPTQRNRAKMGAGEEKQSAQFWALHLRPPPFEPPRGGPFRFGPQPVEP